jgi:hypothetical protein
MSLRPKLASRHCVILGRKKPMTDEDPAQTAEVYKLVRELDQLRAEQRSLSESMAQTAVRIRELEERLAALERE